MKSFVRRLACILVAFAVLPVHASIMIDDFSVDQGPLVRTMPGDVGTPIASTVLDGGILGGERDIRVDLISGPSGNRISVVVDSYNHSQDGGIRGTSQATWDGIDGDGLTVNPIGLGGIDLTEGGTQDALELLLESADLNASLIFEVFTNAGNSSKYTLFLPGGASNTQHVIPYTSFLPNLGAGADFTNVGAITMKIDGSTVASLDVIITLIDTTSVLTATKTGALFFDSDNDGLIEAGETVRYTVTIDNPNDDQNASALNVLFSDTPDPNTNLIVGSVTTTQGTVTIGNTGGDTDIEVDIGDIPDGGSVTITFDVIVKSGTIDPICNQGFITHAFERVIGGGFTLPTDDPTTVEPIDPTCLPVAYCGDGIFDPTDEQCDDGNLNDNDFCSNDCTQGCGNGIVNTGEQCDDGNLNDNDACSNNCTQGCGNGIVNTGEQCDDGNLNDNDACSNNCTQGCGNGIVNTGEACDDGNLNDNDACSNNCTQGCGNGIVNTGEACDDGNLNDNDACSNNCTQGCGNGIVNTGEACDDGNLNDNDACSNNCTQGCGNGIVNTGEACDDGNLNDNDACSNNCTQGCGNGIVNTGEACDDGNLNDNDACSNNCTQGCGNGIVNTGEACDDGNLNDNDACSNNCTQGCGNGIVNTGEQCDDGNANNNDDCSNNCTTGCGNGIVNTGEQCDDGNHDNTDGCTHDCMTAHCGDGFVQAGVEQCDDGNLNNNDACSNNCTQGCGNGIINTGEQCDDGNLNNNDGCSNMCSLPTCGDGILQAGEQCDDHNNVGGDGCSPTCNNEVCGNGILDANEVCDGAMDAACGPNGFCKPDCTCEIVSALCGNGILDDGEQCDGAANDACDGGFCRPDCTCGGSEIPTVSEWGVAVLALLLLTAAKLRFGQRRTA